MPTLEVNQSPLSATAPAFVPSNQSKSNRTNATDGDVNVGGGSTDIVPVPWTSILASGDRRNSSNADDHRDNLGRPLPALRKAKLYSSSSSSSSNGTSSGSGGLDGFGGVVDGSNIDDEENASPVPPSTKKSRIGTIKVTVTGSGLSPMPKTLIATTTTTIAKKRVTISDDGNGNRIGYINGVAIGGVSSRSGNTGSSDNTDGGPGSKCFDVVDLNTKKKSPSLGKYKKTPGPYKSAIALLDALDLSSPEKSPSTAPGLTKKSSSLSFRRTPGAGRKKNSSSASVSTSMNLSRKRLLSTLSIADDDSAGSGIGFGGGGGNTPADRAKCRSLAKAASSATKTKLLQKAKDSGVLDAAASNAKGDGPIPIILSAQSSNGTYLGSNVTIALEGRLQSLTIDGLGDKMGTYRASNQSGLCLHLDRAPIDKLLFAQSSPLAYQPLSKTSTVTNDSTLTIDDDETATVGTMGTMGTLGTIGTIGTVGEHSWRQDISRSPLRTFTITSSNEKKLLSEPLRASHDVYDDNSLIVWTKENDDATVAYDMPREDPFDGDYEYTGLEDDDEESKKGGGQDDEYLADSEGLYDELGTGLTDTSLGGNANLSELMPNVIQRGKTDNVEQDPDSSATLGVSNLSERFLGGHDEDEASTCNNGDAAAATILLSDGDGASGNGTVGTVGRSTSSKVTTGTDIATQRDDSTLHMRSFLAGVATLFLAQVGMAFLGLLSFLLIKSFSG